MRIRIPNLAGSACALALALLAGVPLASHADTDAPPLLVFDGARSLGAGEDAPGLTAEQAATLEAIRSDPRVSGLRLARMPGQALAAVLSQRALALPDPVGGAQRSSLSFTAVVAKHNAEGMVSLSAGSAESGNSASLVVQGADVLGSYTVAGETWRLTPLGGGVTAVYRYDLEGLRMDPPGWGMRQRALKPEPSPMDDAGASVERTDTGDVIDLMVVYTPAAAALGNIDAFIQSAINHTHDSYEKSNIPFRLRLVHKAQVQYTKHSSDMGQDLRRLDEPGDGYMDEVDGFRDRYGADLAALVVAGPTSRVCGVAFVPQFGRSSTY